MAWETDSDLMPMGEILPAYVSTWLADNPRVVKHGGAPQISPAEVDFCIRLKRRGLTEWVQQLQVGPYYIDFAFPEGLAVEIDGRAYHQDQEREKRRDKYLFAHGAREILHFPAAQTLKSYDQCIDLIEERLGVLRA